MNCYLNDIVKYSDTYCWHVYVFTEWW